MIQITFFAFSQEARLMTYNIRLDNPGDGVNAWDNRKDFLAKQILFYAPDIMGVQEALPGQMDDLQEALSDYKYIGVGRDDGHRKGEFSAIFYESKKWEVVMDSTFWLSDSPDKVSMGWDAVCNRVCTFGQFQRKSDKKKIWVFNTHFDHVGKRARRESINLIVNTIKEVTSPTDLVFFMGDLNMIPSDESLEPLRLDLVDSFHHAELNYGPEGTFNGFDWNASPERRIDYIFTRPNIKVKKYAVLSESCENRYPSDHFPVLVISDL